MNENGVFNERIELDSFYLKVLKIKVRLILVNYNYYSNEVHRVSWAQCYETFYGHNLRMLA
jgi:hypothetical protein